MRYTQLIALVALPACALGAGEGAPRPPIAPTTAKLYTQAEAVLRQAVADQKDLVQVHAADALIAFGILEPVWTAFQALLPIDAKSPFRVARWRSLAGAAPTPADRARWVAEIENTFLDRSSELRVGAIESLCKIGRVVTGKVRDAAREMATTASESDTVFALWALYLVGDRQVIAQLGNTLDSSAPVARLRGAYVLRWVGTSDPTVGQKLARAADRARPDDLEYTYVVGAALVLKADPARVATWQAQLENVLQTGAGGARADALQSLMHCYTAADLHRLEPFLHDADAETRIGAARAIMYVLKKK